MADELTTTEEVVYDAFEWLNGNSAKEDAIAESVDVYGPALPEGEVHSRDEWASFIEANHEGFPISSSRCRSCSPATPLLWQN